MMTQDYALGLFEYRDGELFYKRKPSRNMLAGTKAGCVSKGYIVIQHGGVYYLGHRIIYLMFHGWSPETIDHANGDCTNNSIDNLRPCTQSQNMWNSKKPVTNTSGIKGVSYDSARNKWRATCKLRGKYKALGRFNTKEQASEAVRAFREREHKEFAKHE